MCRPTREEGSQTYFQKREEGTFNVFVYNDIIEFTKFVPVAMRTALQALFQRHQYNLLVGHAFIVGEIFRRLYSCGLRLLLLPLLSRCHRTPSRNILKGKEVVAGGLWKKESKQKNPSEPRDLAMLIFRHRPEQVACLGQNLTK
ncbi:unnamed protein product [Pseudo-nitzschia multistriata]|uniref:Uncharacterized protein n=1 Tax=Pseudo-nitzschia multistriata TaxID=183589 RepID=A0A448YUI8_9STRA|nr:unnamed protein product [Pseudo-nitzschia multistriata]